MTKKPTVFECLGRLQSEPCLLPLVLLATVIAGCSSLPRDYPREHSTAFDDYPQTRIGAPLEAAAQEHPGDSGFGLIREGRDALTLRVALTDLAETSLDVQYYLWEADATGRVLAQRLIRAADRGVRVRVLLDDISLSGNDAPLTALDAHSRIEVRVFNPFVNRQARFLDVALDAQRINHRMHNKAMVVDNAVAIVGGRNIGNNYFGVATKANFRDLDLVAAGPIVRSVSHVFDYFWNNEWAVPIAALAEGPYTSADLQDARRAIEELVAEEPYPYRLEWDQPALHAALLALRDSLIWAPGVLYWDDPSVVDKTAEKGALARNVDTRMQELSNELLIESAYYISDDEDIERDRALIRRGVRMRVLTNSLASNDVVAAHAGYAKRRPELLEAGVELYEYRPDAMVNKTRVWRGESKAALHTKAMVFDRQAVLIGSFNLDPRSSDLNTEMGLYVESPELAERVVAYLDQGVRPENSYRVVLDAHGKLHWQTVSDGERVCYATEPQTTWRQRLMSNFISVLPVEQQL